MLTQASHFIEKISPFLKGKLEHLEQRYGKSSNEYLGLARQYIKSELEGFQSVENNLKHYEAGLEIEIEHGELPGIERLYKRTLVIEPTLICAAHCRHCLRQNYGKHTLTEFQIRRIAEFCGSAANRDILDEVLITGGDPLLIPRRIDYLIEALIEHAPNIRIVRIATRLLTQAPERIDESVFNIFREKPGVRFEVATQINHPVEFFPETIEAVNRIQDLGVLVYSQNVLLKGVNDDLDTLVDLYGLMRKNSIEPHYLFHCVPISGIHHLRCSVEKGLQLARQLCSCGRISGRVKPMFAAMTDIGKVVFYEGTICRTEKDRLLLRSGYKLEERLAWNPSWQLPPSASVDEAGYLQIWYTDGSDA